MHITEALNQFEFVWVCDCGPEKHVARMDNDAAEIKCRKCKTVRTAGQLKAEYQRQTSRTRDGWTGTGINRVWRTE